MAKQEERILEIPWCSYTDSVPSVTDISVNTAWCAVSSSTLARQPWLVHTDTRNNVYEYWEYVPQSVGLFLSLHVLHTISEAQLSCSVPYTCHNLTCNNGLHGEWGTHSLEHVQWKKGRERRKWVRTGMLFSSSCPSSAAFLTQLPFVNTHTPLGAWNTLKVTSDDGELSDLELSLVSQSSWCIEYPVALCLLQSSNYSVWIRRLQCVCHYVGSCMCSYTSLPSC